MAITRPAPIMEKATFWAGAPTGKVDRFSLQPGVDYLRAVMKNASVSGEPPPQLFASGTGQLPAYLASGADVDLLRLVAWQVRHAAAATSDSSLLFEMIEVSSDADDDPQRLQTDAGKRALQAYISRVWKWGTAPPPDARQIGQVMTAAEYEQQLEQTTRRAEEHRQEFIDAQQRIRAGLL